jgi:hypothetical protein
VAQNIERADAELLELLRKGRFQCRHTFTVRKVLKHTMMLHIKGHVGERLRNGNDVLAESMCKTRFIHHIGVLAGEIPSALILALRQGAPEHPALAGATAGLFAGAIGAACYATHCPDDSPLFVAAWYTLAIGFVAAIGAAAGKRLLRW